jgi:hypothetical protein
MIVEMTQENTEIEITESEYILLVEQEGDERKYVLRKSPYYFEKKFGRPTNVREIPMEEFAYIWSPMEEIFERLEDDRINCDPKIYTKSYNLSNSENKKVYHKRQL